MNMLYRSLTSSLLNCALCPVSATANGASWTAVPRTTTTTARKMIACNEGKYKTFVVIIVS